MWKSTFLILSLCSTVYVQKIVGDYLTKVDDNIVKWFKDPSIMPKKEIFEMVADYLETLQDLLEKIDLRRKSAIQPGKTLLKRTKPQYLEQQFPEDKLKKEYNWTFVDIDDFKRLLKETELLWQHFMESYKQLLEFVENDEESESID